MLILVLRMIFYQMKFVFRGVFRMSLKSQNLMAYSVPLIPTKLAVGQDDGISGKFGYLVMVVVQKAEMSAGEVRTHGFVRDGRLPDADAPTSGMSPHFTAQCLRYDLMAEADADQLDVSCCCIPDPLHQFKDPRLIVVGGTVASRYQV